MSRPNEFPPQTQQSALARQGFRCASCGEPITRLGEAGRLGHHYGERAEAHHRRPIMRQGSASVDNCVVLCRSCHYSAHEGGNYQHGTVIGWERDFPFFRQKGKQGPK